MVFYRRKHGSVGAADAAAGEKTYMYEVKDRGVGGGVVLYDELEYFLKYT